MDGTKRMRALRKLLLISVALLLVIIVIGWNRRRSADEPAYKGKTVTEWLDSMALLEPIRKSDRVGGSEFLTTWPAAEITNDLALQALVAMGAKAVPVLKKRLSEPVQWELGMPIWQKARFRAVVTWEKISEPSGTQIPSPLWGYNSYQKARNMAAVLGLLAVGTNAGGGVNAVLETQLRPEVLFTVFTIANHGLPERHDEIVASITEGMHSTNATLRKKAVTLTWTFPKDFQKWKGVLLTFASDPQEELREQALWALVTAIPEDDDVFRFAQQTFENTNNPPHLRVLAVGGLQSAGEKAIFTLPVMRQMLISETNSHVRSDVRRAIRSLERRASGRTNAGASIQEKSRAHPECGAPGIGHEQSH